MVVIGAYDFALTLSEEKLENKIISEINLIKEIDCDGYRFGNGSYYLPGSRPATCRDPNHSQERLQFDGEHTYKLILILCLIAAMILGFVQFAGSTYVVCSCNGVREAIQNFAKCVLKLFFCTGRTPLKYQGLVDCKHFHLPSRSPLSCYPVVV